MIHLTLRSEYSFGKAFAHIRELVELPGDAIGIADEASTYGHVSLYNKCKSAGKKPILGVRLMAVPVKIREKQWGPTYIFIAKNMDGLREIYALVRTAYENFYYHPFIEHRDINNISDNVAVIATFPEHGVRIDYIGVSQFTPDLAVLNWDHKLIAIDDNRYITPDDKEVYQLFTGSDAENSTKPQYVLDGREHVAFCGYPEAVANTYELAAQCNVEFKKSPMIKYNGRLKLRPLCEARAKQKGIDLDSSPYKERFDREMELVETKEFVDYFLIVSEIIKHAKGKMLVGPGRGSSGGSLICYLLGITEIDPLKYDLLFERFIDINRHDLPDIDIDFPDTKRQVVIKRLKETYGERYVSHIATVAKMKPKSALQRFAENLSVPFAETEELKGAIIERSGGDARAQMCVKDTFETTEIGKRFIENYPQMKLVERIEGHSSHAGIHAAGIIVCNSELTNYGSVNARNDSIMLDGPECEGLNLLKIDVLGLRTLAVLEEVANRAKFPYAKYYNLDLEDKRVFKTFNDMRLAGIFQFEGYALQSVTRQMGVHCFEDIAAITALARPGPIHSGGTNLFVKRKIGEEDVSYLSEHPSVVDATKDTLGIIIYQEQLMKIAREYGAMTWEEVSKLRKTASKSLGEEYFNTYKDRFMEGTAKNGIDPLEADHVWRNMLTFGSWGFNRSHAVAYALVSYWTAWAKTYYPYEFAAANMNNSRNEDSAIKILRDMVKNEGIEYVSIDPDDSVDHWDITTRDGKTILMGSLTNIPGIGPKKAKDIMARRSTGKLTPNMIKKLMNPETPFDILFPAQHYWGNLYERPWEFGLDSKITFVEDIRGEGEYIFIGKLVDRNLRDLNEYQSVVKRGGEVIENDTLFLNLTLEDDTDSVIATIDRFKFERMGRHIAETGKVGHDWYLVKGYIKGQWRRVNVTEILNLWDWSKE